MPKPVLIGACLRPRVCVGSSETLAVQVTGCPKCKQEFRLMWPMSVFHVPLHRVIHLDCPFCANFFSLVAIDLVPVCEGGEQYAAAEVYHLS